MLCTWPLASDSDIVWKKSQEKSTGSRSEGESVFPERRSKERVRAAISLDAAQTSRHRCRGGGGERGTDRRFMNTPRHHGLRSRSTRTFHWRAADPAPQSSHWLSAGDLIISDESCRGARSPTFLSSSLLLLIAWRRERTPVFQPSQKRSVTPLITLPLYKQKEQQGKQVSPPLAYDSDEGISERVISSTPRGVFEFCQEKLVDPRALQSTATVVCSLLTGLFHTRAPF
ncbi:hypothetical protein CDAR_620771 [Caerostris darwini]|uniref:Uncharacterized protein n=1 Tax=Caerostris darwini TaxID=1538125 RepID=A0AAV4URM9_9ARAC|nr:hypothetical protein CDAR_620771 [Caerostris darwini]